MVIGIEEGIILSSGNVADAANPNDNDGTSTNNGQQGDADLNAIAALSTQDATVLEFDFVPQSDTVSFQYVFASEEYNEYANSSYNDAFGFFLDDQNIALLPGTTTPITINNVNKVNNSTFFNDNDPSDLGSPTSFATEYDGFTTVLTAQADVEAGEDPSH